MLREKLVIVLLKMCTYFSLSVGFFPTYLLVFIKAPSRVYFIYSAIIHCTWMALMPYTFTSYFTEHSFMAEHPLLEWLYVLTNCCKVLCIVAIIGVLWVQRLNILAMYGKINEFFQKIDHSISNKAPSYESIQRVRRTADFCVLGRAFSTAAKVILQTAIAYRMTPVRDWKFLRLSLFSFLLLNILTAANFQFTLMLVKFYEHFEYINIELIDLLYHLEIFDKRLRKNVAWRRHWGDPMGYQLHQRLYNIATMHQKCYILTTHFIKLFSWISLFFTLHTIISNIVVVYHAVLFVTHQMNVDRWGNLNGGLLTIFFYMDTLMLLGNIDMLLGACNRSSQLLRRSNELLQSQRAPCILNKTLEQFSLQLMCRRLHYNVCGLFDFDNAMGLKVIVSALVNVTVLVQYDIKARVGL